jgi:type VI secretion system secreted protein Hcp
MAIDMYMKVDGATGESEDANHKGWIDIVAFKWGANQNSGKHLEEIRLSFCKAGGNQIEYSNIILKDALITSVDFTGSGGRECIGMIYSFQSSKIEFHYWTQLASGYRGPESQMGWDVKANTATL